MRTLPYGFPLLDLAHELSFTLAQLQAHPLGAAYVKDFEELLADTQKALGRQLELVNAQGIAEAKVMRADVELNQILDLTNLTLLGLTDRNRESPLYQRFFGSVRPSDAKRPILGAQLELMRGWLPTLSAATQPELKALSAMLDSAVKMADAAVAALRTAEQENTDWTELGGYKDLLDKANGVRKATHGKLGETVHKNPAANLPNDFAEQFFIHEARWAPPSRAELSARIAKTEQQLARLKQQLADHEEKDAQVERTLRETQAEALREQVAESEKRLAQESARAAALKSQLEKLAQPMS